MRELSQNCEIESQATGSQVVSQSQFRLSTVFWFTTCLCLLMAYSRALGGNALMHGVLYTLFALSSGLIVGVITGRLWDALFWSLLASLLTFLAVAGGRLPTDEVAVGWGVVGAGCGALAGVAWPRGFVNGAISSAILGGGLICAVLWGLGQSIEGLIWFDVGCAIAVGGLFRPAIDFLKRFEERAQQPRVVLASWLSICILIGNFLVPIIGGVQR